VSPRRPPWTATVRLTVGRAELARWLAQALAPEAAREVPRSRATVRRSGPVVELRIGATDAGAMRAALNTYLGWISLALAALGASRGPVPGPTTRARAEALISRSP
jgi:tRNA threonylcarbamoyladenosine modification (KEOPS) complex  Pcc1 subunit